MNEPLTPRTPDLEDRSSNLVRRFFSLDKNFYSTLSPFTQGLVVQPLDSAIHRIKIYPAWITQLFSQILIRCILIYPVDSAIQHLNNQGPVYNWVTATYCLGAGKGWGVNPAMD